MLRAALAVLLAAAAVGCGSPASSGSGGAAVAADVPTEEIVIEVEGLI